MKLSRTKIAKLLKSGNQSRKHLHRKSKTFDNKTAFKDEDLILSTNANHSKSIDNKHTYAGKKQRTARAGKRHVNLRLKTMKNAAWNKKHFAADEPIKQSGGVIEDQSSNPNYKFIEALQKLGEGVSAGQKIDEVKYSDLPAPDSSSLVANKTAFEKKMGDQKTS